VALALGFAAFAATLLGGAFALRFRDQLHLILGFSSGAVLGVALFDLLPESIELTRGRYGAAIVTVVVGIGFFAFMLLSRVVLLHPESEDAEHGHADERAGSLGAASLALHSFLDGTGIGLAFKVSPTVGGVVAAAVLAHDFSDGINTVTMILRTRGRGLRAVRWLLLDAAAPVIGVATTFFYSLSDTELGLVLAVFCGFFLYIGASDLLPESHHRHPKRLTSLMNILGAAFIWIAVHFA
jgi:ZIP family zinc transporter